MNIQEMMKQAKLMQQKMEELQARLSEQEVTGLAGGGMVKVVMTCRGDVREVAIDPAVINPVEKETLEDLVKAACNMARENADRMMTEGTAKLMSDMGLPANFELPKF